MQTCITSCLVLLEGDTLRIHATQFPLYNTQNNKDNNGNSGNIHPSPVSVNKNSATHMNSVVNHLSSTLKRLEIYTHSLFRLVVHPDTNAQLPHTDAHKNLVDELCSDETVIINFDALTKSKKLPMAVRKQLTDHC